MLIAAIVLLFMAVVAQPDWLNENKFLIDFVNHEMIALMAVVVTVTLASVANIHLALNKLVIRRFDGDRELKSAAIAVKQEMNDNAWIIFAGFGASLIVVLIKGGNMDVPRVVAAMHACALWLLFLYGLCMYDIYRVIFGIVTLEMDIGEASEVEQDYSEESPSIGSD